MLNRLRNLFVIPMPEACGAELQVEQNRTNVKKVRTVVRTFFVLSLFMTLFSLLKDRGGVFERPERYYFFLYLLMMAGMLVYWRVFAGLWKDIAGHGRGVQAAGISFTCFVLFWSVGISLLDQLSYGQIIVYQTAVISIAVVPLFQPIVFFCLYLSAQVLFAVLLPLFQHSGTMLFGHYINSSLFLLMSFAISRIRFQTWLEDFDHKRIIREKIEEIQTMNEKLETANRQLKKLSQTDGLTGVYNRTMFDRTLRTEWDRCRRQGVPLSLFMMDIDCFKAFNDHYGHQAGDRCIMRIASALSAAVRRSSDLVARYGGDEFSVILPYMDEEKARELADQMKKTIDGLQIPHTYSGVSDRVTVSIGIHTVIPSDGLSADEFVRAADVALYRAKEVRDMIAV